jgi:hypothetical protein
MDKETKSELVPADEYEEWEQIQKPTTNNTETKIL